MAVLNFSEENRDEVIRLENIMLTLEDRFKHNPESIYKAIAYIIAKKIVKTPKDFENLQNIIR